MNSTMTVGELKQLLANTPDHFSIVSVNDNARIEDIEIDDDEETVYLYMESE